LAAGPTGHHGDLALLDARGLEDLFCAHLPDVALNDLNVWSVLTDGLCGESIGLDRDGDLETGLLKAEVEAERTRKQRHHEV
jgi:hypothetical protein